MKTEASEQPEPEAIYGVLVPGREEGFYLFADLHDAEDFAWAVRDHGDVAELSEELLYPYLGAGELIDAEALHGDFAARALTPLKLRDASEAARRIEEPITRAPAESFPQKE